MTYQTVTLRGRVHAVRGKGKSAFLVLRQQTATIQVVFFVDDVNVSKGMVKWVSNLTKESVVDISGLVTKPAEPVASCTQTSVELVAQTTTACRDRFPCFRSSSRTRRDPRRRSRPRTPRTCASVRTRG